MKKILAIAFTFVTLTSSLFAQDSTKTSKKGIRKWLKGSFYATYGYQRNQYSRSDIHFKDNSNPPGGNYDFTIYNVAAHDKPDFDDVFNRPISVPQYVLNLGYFFNDKRDLGIEVCWDHLKYVMTQNQPVQLIGFYDGQYHDEINSLSPSFLRYEHTNGNNYLMLNLVKRYKLFDKERQFHKLSLIGKVGAGLLVPKTESFVIGLHNDGPFRVSGSVYGASVAIRYDIFKYFFVELSTKGCFVDYSSVKLYHEGRADQTFWSMQYAWSGGLNFPIGEILNK